MDTRRTKALQLRRLALITAAAMLPRNLDPMAADTLHRRVGPTRSAVSAMLLRRLGPIRAVSAMLLRRLVVAAVAPLRSPGLSPVVAGSMAAEAVNEAVAVGTGKDLPIGLFTKG